MLSIFDYFFVQKIVRDSHVTLLKGILVSEILIQILFKG